MGEQSTALVWEMKVMGWIDNKDQVGDPNCRNQSQSLCLIGAIKERGFDPDFGAGFPLGSV